LMNVDEARAILGLEGPVSPDELKRAYLKSVKAHSPERDPEGFRRVREAFDWLKARPWLLNVESVATSSEWLPAPPLPASNAVEPSEQENPPPEVEPAPEDDAGAYLVPQSVLAAESVRERAESLIAQHRSAVGMGPWAHSLETVLELVDQGDVALANKLFTAFGLAIERAGLGARELSPDVASRWKLVGEVIALSNAQGVPSDVTSAIAAALRAGKLGDAWPPVREAWLKFGSRFRRPFRAQAPMLAKAIERGTVRRASTGRSALAWFALALLVGSMNFLATFAQSSRREALHSDPVPREVPSWALQRDVRASTLAAAIDMNLASGACGAVAEQWPQYVAAVRATASESERADFNAKRERARQECNQLGSILLEKP